ncbi:hypothetical protein ACFP1L_04745 [Lactiplantibacillus nangangensis]|uniref:Uncharacterized protein n=1 Tax=Lactiplantibacillus nangangensis TaxID=2559917 RepID=A0ABW1SI55_9LACO|nr:hypothetical protein [Lactiplantibacillus nangangensis]
MKNSNQPHPSFNDYIWSKLPNTFDLTNQCRILRWAQPVASVKLSFHNTFYLLDISRENCLENAVIFDLQRGILKTTQTTRELMRAMSWQAPYWQHQYIEQVALMNQITCQKLPFINGNVCLIPLSAVTQKSTSWLSSVQLTDLTRIGPKRTELNYLDLVHLIVPISFKRLQRQLNDSQRLQLAMISTLIAQQQFSLVPLAQRCDWKMLCGFAQFTLESHDYVVTQREIERTTDKYFGKF